MNSNRHRNVFGERVRAYYAAQWLPDERVARILAAAAVANSRRAIRWWYPPWLAAAAALVILLGGATLWHATPTYAAGRVVAEAAQTHLKAHPPDMQGDCFDRVGAALDKLDFPLKPSPDASFPAGLTVLGGRYCTLQGQRVAQILLEDADGRRCTLFVARSDDTRLARIRDGAYEKNGVHVRIWHDAGRLFVMAG